MDHIYGELNQIFLPSEYTGDTTSTVEVVVDNVNKKIYANAHLDDSSIAAQIQEWVSDNLNYTDKSASSGAFLYGIDESAGKVTNVRRRQLSDIELSELIKVRSDLEEIFVKQEPGKGLSTEDYTSDEKQKLAGIEEHANNYSLPIASENTLGGIKVGENLTIDEDGTLNAQQGGYELPIASAETLGGIRVGKNLTVDPETGTLDAENASINFATFSIDPITMQLVAHWAQEASEEIIFTLNNKKELEVTIV